jgi:hypothetical protein
VVLVEADEGLHKLAMYGICRCARRPYENITSESIEERGSEVAIQILKYTGLGICSTFI